MQRTISGTLNPARATAGSPPYLWSHPSARPHTRAIQRHPNKNFPPVVQLLVHSPDHLTRDLPIRQPPATSHQPLTSSPQPPLPAVVTQSNPFVTLE
jgi:hypothetical protein